MERILLNSIHLATHTDLATEDGNDLIDRVILLSRKLLSVWMHQQADQPEQDELARRSTEWPATHREHSQKLYEEFGVFSVQIKSTLDHLVQIMRPILGRKTWTMYTFSGKGETVFASLQRNTSKHHAGHVRLMEHHLFGENNRGLVGVDHRRSRPGHHGLAGDMKIERLLSTGTNPEQKGNPEGTKPARFISAAWPDPCAPSSLMKSCSQAGVQRRSAQLLKTRSDRGYPRGRRAS